MLTFLVKSSIKMRVIILITLFAFVQYVTSYKIRRDLNEINQICERLCRGCGGFQELKEDNCVCTVEIKDEHTRTCLDAAESRANWLDMGWTVKNLTRERRSLHEKNHVVKKVIKRTPRSADFFQMADIYGAPWLFPSNNRDLRSWQLPNSNVNQNMGMGSYGIPLPPGNSIEFTAPNDDTIEIEHHITLENDYPGYPYSSEESFRQQDWNRQYYEGHPSSYQRL